MQLVRNLDGASVSLILASSTDKSFDGSCLLHNRISIYFLAIVYKMYSAVSVSLKERLK